MMGQRILRARKAAGLSLRDLAGQTGLSHTALNKFEKEQLTPSSSQLHCLAQALGVRGEYFFRAQQPEIQGIEYRKRSTLSKKLLDRIHANVLDQAERWQELLALFPQRPIPYFGIPQELPRWIDHPTDIEALALALRSVWQLGLNPIPDLIDVLESRGIAVFITEVDAERKFDGLAGRIADTPVVVISSHWCGDRQRLTLAHELGHLLLESRLASGIDLEKACNRFAGAFLLPGPALIEQLGEHRNRLELQELYCLKQEFGLSMQACLFRALDLEIIKPTEHQRLFKWFSIKGWRKTEPGQPYPPERTFLFRQLVYRALAEDYIGESKAAELLGLPLAELRDLWMQEAHDALTDQ